MKKSGAAAYAEAVSSLTRQAYQVAPDDDYVPFPFEFQFEWDSEREGNDGLLVFYSFDALLQLFVSGPQSYFCIAPLSNNLYHKLCAVGEIITVSDNDLTDSSADTQSKKKRGYQSSSSDVTRGGSSELGVVLPVFRFRVYLSPSVELLLQSISCLLVESMSEVGRGTNR